MLKTPIHLFGYIFLFLSMVGLGVWSYTKKDIDPRTYISPAVNITAGNISNEAIPMAPIRPILRMGIVELSVQDLEKMTNFYQKIVGLDLISNNAGIANLGTKDTIFLRLKEEKNFIFPKQGEAGLYHIAITHNNRKDVAQRVSRILELTPERYQGSSDHSATEAFYFSDPENNGLELYYDRPRSEWIYKNGKPVMGSSAIDTMKYIEKYKNIPISSGDTQMGHIHLKIGNIENAKSFYQNILLFDEINTTDTALFISRDGYHHNIGMNTWESLGAGKRTKNTFGLKSFELIYDDEIVYNQIISNLEKNNISIAKNNNRISIEDPWGNLIHIIKK